jgi:hypothetical protein
MWHQLIIVLPDCSCFMRQYVDEQICTIYTILKSYIIHNVLQLMVCFGILCFITVECLY